MDLHLDHKAPLLPGDPGDLRLGQHADALVLFQPAVVDLQPAAGGAELGEVAVELGHAPAQVGVAFDEDDMMAHLGRLEGRRDAGHAASHHKDALVCHDGSSVEAFTITNARAIYARQPGGSTPPDATIHPRVAGVSPSVTERLSSVSKS
jgi:hypothetical protein